MQVTDKEILHHLKYIYFQAFLCLHDSQLQDRREGGVAGATAPGPGPR